MGRPPKSIVLHLAPRELDEAVDDAQRSDEARLVRRLCLIENLYAGDTVTEAAERVGVSQPTASRWTDAWNDGGVDGLRPDFGGGRPPALTEAERDRLADALERDRSPTTAQVADFIEEEFDVSYSRRHVARIVDDLS